MTELVGQTLDDINRHQRLIMDDIITGRVNRALGHRLTHYEEVKPTDTGRVNRALGDRLTHYEVKPTDTCDTSPTLHTQ